ncbi:MAG: DciA family protein [Candidatus Saccharimonadales bacterium]
MMNLDDILKARADSFDLERGDQLAAIQEVLNEKYLGRVRAKKLQDGLLSISTPSSAVANDIRLRQVGLIKRLKKFEITEIKVRIE